MFKKIFLIALLTLIPTIGSSITTESLDQAISNIEATYKGINDMTTNFTQSTFVAVLNKKVGNNGVIRWKKPGNFFIEYTGSEPRQYISNNEKLWIYVPNDTQVEVYSVSDKSVPKEALEFMRGFVNIKKYYKITGWKKKGNETDFVFIPQFDNAPYSKLECHFRGDNILSEVTIHNTTGNISVYKFADVQTNTGLSSDIFKFNKPKGVKEVHGNY